MIEELIIMQSDAVSRYHTRFSVGALMGALSASGEIGLPFLLNHDGTRPLGWILPSSLHLQSGQARLLGLVLMPESKDDFQSLKAIKNAYLGGLAHEHQAQIDELRCLIAGALAGDERLVINSCVSLVGEGLARRIAPELFDELDRDGLISLDRLEPVGPGMYRLGECVVFAHPGLRRSNARPNTLNQPFLARLQDAARNDGAARIRLDPDMVGLAASYHDYFEYAYWWGPRFDDDLAAIDRGVTRHEASETERMIHGISRTEFWWHHQDDQPTLEVEELRDIPTLAEGGDQYACRYAHAYVDQDNGQIVHFDGATRVYAEELMLERLDTSIDRFGRRSDYTKLWRLDSPLSVTTWKELLSDYFRDNTLVGEYLGAVEDSGGAVTGGIDVDVDCDPIAQLFPYTIQRGEGLQVALSLRPANPNTPTVRAVYPLDFMVRGQEQIRYVPSEVIELRKLIRRRGGELHIPDDVAVVTRKDLYKALPLIVHHADATPQDIDLTMDALTDLVQTWNTHEFDLVTALNVACTVEDREVRIAVLGHCAEVASWLKSPLAVPPTTLQELEDWAEQVAAFLSQHSNPPPRTFPVLDVLMGSGVFVLPNQIVDPNEFSIETEIVDEGLEIRVAIPEDKPGLRLARDSGQVHIARLFEVKRSSCSACGAEYMTCEHSKLVDSGVYQTIEDIGIAAVTWTDRPIQ